MTDKSIAEVQDEAAAAETAGRRTARDRKSIDRFKVEVPKTPEKLQIVAGLGTKLADLPRVRAFVEAESRKGELLKQAHRLLFGRPGKEFDLKKHILEFSGYPVTLEEYSKVKTIVFKDEKKSEKDGDAEESSKDDEGAIHLEGQLGKLGDRIMKLSTAEIRHIMQLFDVVERSGNKGELALKLLLFLCKPKPSGIKSLPKSAKKAKKAKTPEKAKAKAAGGKKKAATVTGKRKASKDEEESDSAAESEEEKPKAKAAAPKKEKSEKPAAAAESDDEAVTKPAKKAKKAPAEAKPKKVKIDAAESTPKKIERVATKAEPKRKHDEDSDSDSKPLKPAKTAAPKKADAQETGATKLPSSKEISAALKAQLKGADLGSVTQRSLREQLSKHFGVNLDAKKAEINQMIVELLQE